MNKEKIKSKMFVTCKTTPENLKRLNTICGYTGERQYEVLERLLKQELEKCTQKEA